MSDDNAGQGRSLDDVSVVDCDVHVMRPEEVQAHKAEYMEMPFRVQVEPGAAGAGGGYPTRGHVVHNEAWDFDYTETESGGIESVEEDLRETHMEDAGVDVPIVNMGPLSMDDFPETERRRQEMYATNNTLLDVFLDPHDDIAGLASIAPSLLDEAAEEIDRIGDEDGIVGLYVDMSDLDPPLGNPKYDPVLEAAEDNGLPIVMHGSESSTHLPNLHKSVESHLEEYTVGNLATHTINLASLLYRGVPERYPDLEFVSLSAGIEHAAALIHRMNRDWNQRAFDAPLLEAPPEEYIRRNFYFGTHPLGECEGTDHLEAMTRVVGDESLLYGSNYPLYDQDPPAALFDRIAEYEDFDADAVMGGNAVEVFGLDSFT